METQEMEEVLMRKKRMGMLLCMILMAAALSACAGKTDDKKQGTKTAGTKKDESKEERTAKGESEKGMTAPDFEVTLLSGKTVKLSDYRGKRVLLNFWATWCGPCVQEMPAFQRLSEDYPDDVVILAVNCGESKEEVPIALDENLEASNLYPATSIPLTLIVDEEGDIVYSSYGASDADTMYAHYKEELGL